MALLRGRRNEDEGLEQWLAAGYDTAYRTAWLILHDRADAEEAVQEAFLRAWRFRDAIPPSAEVAPWLHRVVVNACLSRLRAERARGGRERPALVDSGGPEAEGPEAVAEIGAVRHDVVVALASLPEHLRVVVVLRYFGQLSEKEIASVIRRRPGTVKSRLHEARARLGADPNLAPHRAVPDAGEAQ